MIIGKLIISIWILLYLILVMFFHCDFDKGEDEFLFMSSMVFSTVFVSLMWWKEISKLLGD